MAGNELIEERGGRYYDARLGALCDEMYEFAEEHGMALKPRYHDAPSWGFTWNATGLRRTIEVLIQERSYIELHIIPHARRDDWETGIRHFMRKPIRGYILFLPLDKEVFLETVNMARADALSFTQDDLKDTTTLAGSAR